MFRRSALAVALLASALAASASTALAADGALNAYRLEATAENLKILNEAGFDLTEGRDLEKGTIEVVGTAGQVAATKLKAEKLTNNRAAPAPSRSTRATPTDGASDAAWTVWTKYDAVAGDEKEQYTEQYARLVADNPGLVAKRVTGTTYNGREIVALQVTKGATGADIPGRPAVLYNAMQHAREWLAGETCRRTLEYFVSNYGKGTSAGREVTGLVDSTEIWFVCVNNPDGYEFTFTPGNRLWRKNLAEINGQPGITIGDGVDPNRNFSSNWGRDDEGSSPDPVSDTYRGPTPASEPETKAMEALFAEIHPVFQKNDHTAAELLLYPNGFQQDTPTADHEIFTALAGDPFKPAIPGFVPSLSAELYITNGDFTDWAYNSQKTLSFTPEGTESEGDDVSVFEFADSEPQVEQEFQRHLPFALDLAKSADDPSEPDSHLDNKAEDFTVESFAESFGDPQPVNAVVKRKLGTVEMRYSINEGPTRVVSTREYRGGERYYKEEGVYYHRVRGFVVGTKPGDSVKVWFAAGGKESAPFTYSATSETDNPVLILANEDYSGVQPNPAPLDGPQYLAYYTAALDAAGVEYDIYDVDDHGRRPPTRNGILSHYSHVVWYTGDDYLPRDPQQVPGSGITRAAVDTQNAVRDFLNEGGKLFYTGKNAGRAFAEGFNYNPFQEEEGTYCQGGNPTCIAVQDDFLQYYLGAHTYVGGGGEDENHNPYPVDGTVGPFDPLSLTFNGEDSAQNNNHTATLLTTSSVLDPEKYPLYADSKAVAAWMRPFAAPFDPHDGDWFLSAGAHDAAYKRLLKPFTTPAGGATLKFWTSYDLEFEYDYMFVEIRTAGQDDWTTLEDANGHTSDGVGLSCPSTGDGSDWQSIHPFLKHYQTKSASGDSCASTGTTGEWNAATGNSGGWQEWSVPIPAAYLGKNVEIAISVASDPATLGLGAWLDEVRLLDAANAPIQTADPSFEAGLDGWTLPGPPGPAGDQAQSQETGWVRAQTAPFVETPIVTTTDTVFTGFAFEAITGAANRAALMEAVFGHLGAPVKPRPDAPQPKPLPPGGGGPQNPPPATRPPATKPPVVTPGQRRLLRIVVNRARQMRRFRTIGIPVALHCDVGCTVRIDLVVPRSTARRYGLSSTLIGRATVTMTRSGRRVVAVRVSRAAKSRLRRARRLSVSVRAVQTDTSPAVRKSARVRVR